METAYRERERLLAGVMEDRADWENATTRQRQLAIAADAELRRRHPDQPFPPLRSVEPKPVTDAEASELNLAPGQPIPEIGQWITDLTAARTEFARQLADRQSQHIPCEDLGCGYLGPAFPAWEGPGRDAILQPPRPPIPASARVLERARQPRAEMEAGY